jgi:hypothetical protein
VSFSSLVEEELLLYALVCTSFPENGYNIKADNEVYHKIRDRYSALLQKAKVCFYTDMIDQCGGNPISYCQLAVQKPAR